MHYKRQGRQVILIVKELSNRQNKGRDRSHGPYLIKEVSVTYLLTYLRLYTFLTPGNLYFTRKVKVILLYQTKSLYLSTTTR